MNICRVSNWRAMLGRTFQIFVLKYWWMMRTLRVIWNLSLSHLAISIAFSRILLIPSCVFGKLISTRMLWNLSIKLFYVTWMEYNHRISSPMFPFWKRICVNTTNFSNKSNRNLLLANISLKTILHSQNNKMYQFSSRSKSFWIKLMLKSALL